MSPYIIGYLVIFIPLVSSLLCFLISLPNSSFIISTIAKSFITVLLVKLVFELLIYEKIATSIEIGILSIPTEYSIDLVSVFFLITTIFIKLTADFYYKKDVDDVLVTTNSQQLFYGAGLLNLFGLIGIFITNNILNLYIYIEIYSFTFYVIMANSNSLSLTKLSFKYFCHGAAGSLLLLISFLLIYLITSQLNLNFIINDISYLLRADPIAAKLIFSLTFIGILLKFFPIWLYFDKIKSNNFIANFLAISSLFIKTNLGVYLLIRLVFFLFGSNFSFHQLKFDLVLAVTGIVLVFYSNLKLFKNEHLRVISSYLFLTNLGFILIGIAIAKKESLAATFLYIINYSTINLLIFFFASYLSKNLLSCNIKHLHLLKRNNFFSVLPIKIIIFFIASFPFTISFIANWNLAYSVMNFDFYLFVLAPLVTTSFVTIKLAIKMINYFYFPSGGDDSLRKQLHIVKANNFIYISCFWFVLVIAAFLGLMSSTLTSFTELLSIYVLSHTL